MSLNLNPLETNLVNLVIVISLLVWFLRGFLGGILERRRAAILQDLQDAESRLKTATENLSQAQSELAAAQQKAEKIRADGQARAAGIRAEGEKRTISAMAASRPVPMLMQRPMLLGSRTACVVKLLWRQSTMPSPNFRVVSTPVLRPS